MSLRIPTNRGIAALAAAAMLTVTLPAGSALAQKIKNPAPEVVEPATKQVATAHRVEIDTITAVDANLDEATLRDIFSGNIEGNAQALATLSATSITIPRIDIAVEADSGEEGKPIQTTIVLSDLVLTDVVDGVAATVSLSSTAVSSGDNGSAEIGTIAAKTLDIGGILGLYGLIEADPSQALATIYTDFSFDGGSIETPEVSCTLGSITVAELKARPLQHTMGEMMALSEAMDAQEEDEQPSPEIVGAALRMYADILTAFETSPVEFGGFECDGVDEEDRPLAVAVEGMSMGGMRPGIYPQITLDGMSIAVEGDGSIGVGQAVFKQFDLSGSIAAIQNAPETIDQAWLDANARALVPAFSGFSFDQVSVDVPDPENAAARIKGSLGSFDVTLADYRNGIPTDFLMSANNIAFAVPEDITDPQLMQLRNLGVTDIDASFNIAAAWDEPSNSIEIKEVSVTGENLARIVLAGTITNATAALFDLDPDTALAAGMGLAVGKLNVDIADQGLTDIIFAAVAADQGADPATLRPVFAGLAEGTVVGMLAGAAEAQNVGRAINSFVSGQAKNLHIDMTAKEQPGLSMADFMAAQSDPTALIGKVTINATAQ